jgi:hypothetical protein
MTDLVMFPLSSPLFPLGRRLGRRDQVGHVGLLKPCVQGGLYV